MNELWGKPVTTTWLDRPGRRMSTRETLPTGDDLRWVLHRWSDTGETTLRRLEGDGSKGTLVEHEHHDLGITKTWSAAICAADVIRRRALTP